MPRQVYPPKREEGLCLLSIDTGEPRAISQLMILATLMDRLNSEGLNNEEKRPCEAFDMIGGTGTGGFIAIMLVILGIDAKAALEEFIQLSTTVLEVKGLDTEARTNLLQKYVNHLIKRHEINEKTKLLDSNDCSKGCKLVVPISNEKNVGDSLTLRNFDMGQDPSLNLTITEALLATLATPPLFTSSAISKDTSTFEYTRGDIKIGNPTQKIIAEACAAFGSEHLVACVLNLGCDHLGIVSTLDDAESRKWDHYLENLFRDSEQMVQELEAQMGYSGVFQRLSVAIGLEERDNQTVSDSRMITTHTEAYLNDVAVEEKMEMCIKSLKTRLSISSLGQIDQTGGVTYASSSLPPLTEKFVMRKEPWKFIEKVLLGPQDDERSRMLIVTGMGGCGKTQLVLKYIKQYSNRFSLRLFIDGSSETRIRSEIVRHIRSLGVEHSQKTFGECLDYLAQPSPDGPRVIVYDNVDDTTIDLLSLLPEGNECQIAITSRNRSVGELRPDSHLELDIMSPEEAVELLMRPPRRSQLSEDKAREIAEQLGHLPIALMQARSYMYQTHCSGTKYLKILKENQAELLAEPVKYQKDMRYLSTDAAFAASFGQLMERTQQFVFLLSNFHRNNFPLGLIMISAKYRFAEQENEHIEHGDDYYSGRAVLENIFLQDGKWSLSAFNKMIISLQNYSLITIMPGVDTRLVQMHSLVHTWIKSHIPKDVQLQYQSAAILLLALGAHIEHTPVMEYPPIHATDFIFVWNHLHIDDVGPFGHILYNDGIFDRALLFGESVVAELRGRNDIPRKITNCIVALDVAYNGMGQLNKARVLEEEVLQLRKEILGECHPSIINTSHNLAIAYDDLALFEKARVLKEEALRLRKETVGDSERHVDIVNAFHNLAITYRELGQLEEARVLQEEVLRLRREHLGEQHLDTIKALSSLALTYTGSGRVQEAKVLKEEVLRSSKEILGKRHLSTIRASSSLADTYRHLGRLEEARVIHEDVLQLFKESLGERHLETIRASSNLARTYEYLCRVEEARVLHEEVLQLFQEILGERHPDTIAASSNLVKIYRSLRQWDRCRLVEEDNLSLMTEIMGEQHPRTIQAMLSLSITYVNLRQIDQALTVFETAKTIISETLEENDFMHQKCIVLESIIQDAQKSSFLTMGRNFLTRLKGRHSILDSALDHTSVDRIAMAIVYTDHTD